MEFYRKFLEVNPQRVASLVLQAICGPDDGFFAKDLWNSVGQRIKDGAIDGRLLHPDFLEPEVGTIRDKTRLKSTTFKVNSSGSQRLELFAILCRDTNDISRVHTNHTSLGTVCGSREVVENRVDLVTFTDPNIREISKQDSPWSRLLRS